MHQGIGDLAGMSDEVLESTLDYEYTALDAGEEELLNAETSELSLVLQLEIDGKMAVCKSRVKKFETEVERRTRQRTK